MNRDFKGIWIPKEIWLMEGISIQEKALWAEIHSLYDPQCNGCYASNDYLTEFIGVKERRIQEMISNLKSHGLVEQVSFDGRKRVIKALPPPTDSPPCGAEVQNNAPLPCSKAHPSGALSRVPSYIENKVYRKEEKEEGGKPPARSDFSAKEKEIERAQHVATTPAEHDRLTEELGEAMMKKVYERLSVYKRQTPKAKWKKHDNLSIRNWVIDAVRDDEKKSPDMKSRQEEAQDFMKSWEHPNDIKCAYYSEYLEFSKLGSAHTWSIKYTEKGFINQLESLLRKLGCRQPQGVTA